ncbi:MAG: hypothetical protein LDL41_24855 [Coleofasciculus sp. S288]|nr:hypothetical protein [Coleofasciculus sp. S288]
MPIITPIAKIAPRTARDKGVRKEGLEAGAVSLGIVVGLDLRLIVALSVLRELAREQIQLSSFSQYAPR